MTTPQVVIVGAGFGGINAARGEEARWWLTFVVVGAGDLAWVEGFPAWHPLPYRWAVMRPG